MNQTKYWIALERQQGIGPAHLIELHGILKDINVSLSDLFEITADEIKAEFSLNSTTVKAIAAAAINIDQIESDYLKVLDSGINVIPFFSQDYPPRLTQILGNTMPPFLYTIGRGSILSEDSIAVLGDKNTSDKGLMIAYYGTKELTRHGIIVISGMAAGIGVTVHRSALENRGTTAAVIPGGIFNLKIPEQLKDSLDPDRIVFVSPFYPSTEFNTFNGYIRNRIICALSKGVFIVEAPVKKGIFEAAKSAHKLKIPLFTAEYSDYPENAAGNPVILETMEGIPVRGKMENDLLIPNMDKIVAAARFSE